LAKEEVSRIVLAAFMVSPWPRRRSGDVAKAKREFTQLLEIAGRADARPESWGEPGSSPRINGTAQTRAVISSYETMLPCGSGADWN
jgi:hypothetical protein